MLLALLLFGRNTIVGTQASGALLSTKVSRGRIRCPLMSAATADKRAGMFCDRLREQGNCSTLASQASGLNMDAFRQ